MAGRCMGIIVGGGPAPGINGVIGAATINAINYGFKVRGFYDGFKWLVGDGFDVDLHSVELRIPDVARIHFDGGSVLRTSRTSLLDNASVKAGGPVQPDPKKLNNVLAHFDALGITDLMTIGGDDTALSARMVAAASNGAVRMVHVPKTIDNDLPLSGDLPTFGFNSARHYGAQLVANLMEDSRTTSRWYLVIAMGRSAGFLAIETAKAAGATMCLIPEELPERTSVSNVVDILEGSILKRRAMGRPDGVAVVAEGLAYKFGSAEELEQMLHKEIPRDAMGHLRLSEVPLDHLLKNELEKRFKARGDSLTIVAVTLGYELRCAQPTPFDMAYCRDLGHGAVSLLVTNSDTDSGVMVTIQGGDLKPVRFEDMIDPETNRTKIRQVNLLGTSYTVARSYMIRLEKSDFESRASLAAIAAQAGMTPEAFDKRYRHVVEDSVVQLPPALARSQVARVVDDPIASHRGKTSQALPM